MYISLSVHFSIRFLNFLKNIFISKWNMIVWESVVLNTGCKESQFYSLPFRQALASMY